MGEDVDPLDADDAGWEDALRARWLRLGDQNRPQDPDTLVEVIRAAWQYPDHGIMEDTPDARAAIRALDEAYDRFAEAAEGLREVLIAHEHYFVLPALLAARSPPHRDSASIEPQLRAVQLALEAFPEVPRLSRRRKRVGRKAVQQPRTRVIVQAVAWYLVNVEQTVVTSSFAMDGKVLSHPTSRAAVLAEATLQALGLTVDLSKLRNHLREVRKLDLGSYNLWAICKPL
jgi:hypothetical protein